MAKSTNTNKETAKAVKTPKTTSVEPKATKAKAVKSMKVKLHKPGELPGEVSVPTGILLKDFIADMNISGYEVKVSRKGSILGSRDDMPLEAGDLVRIGVKTKNN